MNTAGGRLGRWWTGVERPAADLGVACLVAVVVNIAIHVANEPSSRGADLYAYLLGICVGAVLLARRRYPLAVLLATTVLLFTYYTVGYPGIEPALPLSVALYTAAAAGYLRWSLSVAGLYAIAGILVEWLHFGEPLLPLLNTMAEQVALLGVVSLFGETVRSRRVRLAEARARLDQVELARERETARRVAEERLHIAKDVHDIVGHSLAAVTVQAGFAQDLLAERPEDARKALEEVLRAARDAMSDLKVTVDMVQPATEWAPAPSLSDLRNLTTAATKEGLTVTLTVEGDPRPLAGVIEVSAYRIVEEALGEISQHAHNTCATVMIRYQSDSLDIEVIADRTDAATGMIESAGPGLVMAERVAALDGELDVVAPDGGYRLRVRLPTMG